MTQVNSRWTPERLKAMRKSLSEKRGYRVSQEVISRECGVSAFTVGAWEQGRQEPAFYNAVVNLMRLEREAWPAPN